MHYTTHTACLHTCTLWGHHPRTSHSQMNAFTEDRPNIFPSRTRGHAWGHCRALLRTSRSACALLLRRSRAMSRTVLVPGSSFGDGDPRPREIVDDTLQVDAGSITLMQERFPRFCPYHLLHNLLGGHYSRSPPCSAEPFKDVQCVHGSHSRPPPDAYASTACPAQGAVVYLPFGLSCRAGCVDSLAVGCVACPGFGTTMACASCRVRWNADGGPWCASDENIWYTLHKHSDDCECGDCPERVEPDGNGWAGDGDGDGEDDGEDGEERTASGTMRRRMAGKVARRTGGRTTSGGAMREAARRKGTGVPALGSTTGTRPSTPTGGSSTTRLGPRRRRPWRRQLRLWRRRKSRP